jgi:hypothetical protein
MASNLKLINCLLLEFAISHLQITIDCWFLKLERKMADKGELLQFDEIQ